MQSWNANVPNKDDEELKNTFHIVQLGQMASEFNLRLYRKPGQQPHSFEMDVMAKAAW